jgi:c(7)-type cytochrome triheme protein
MRTRLITAVLAFGGLACAQAAALVFDLPEPTPKATAEHGIQDSTASPQDTARPAIEAVESPDSVLALLPRHDDGGIDWGAALRKGIVQPRRAAPGATIPDYVEGFGYDFLMPGPDKMFDAAFPHSGHVGWLACSGCHPTVFPYRGAKTSMQEIGKGQSCGVCHGKVGFSAGACSRCHAAMPHGTLTAQLDTGIVLARAVDTTQGPAALFAPSRFTHWPHRIRYRCSACHNSLFAMRAGSDTLTMEVLREGRACGACHDGRAAFTMSDCTRCHDTPAAPGP